MFCVCVCGGEGWLRWVDISIDATIGKITPFICDRDLLPEQMKGPIYGSHILNIQVLVNPGRDHVYGSWITVNSNMLIRLVYLCTVSGLLPFGCQLIFKSALFYWVSKIFSIKLLYLDDNIIDEFIVIWLNWNALEIKLLPGEYLRH